MNNRRHPRVAVDKLTVDVANGIGVFSGDITNISRFGLCLANMAKKLGKDQEKLTIVVSGQGKHFKFKISPKWEKEEFFGKKIGAAIENAPWEWTEFVIDCGETQDNNEEDVWGRAE